MADDLVLEDEDEEDFGDGDNEYPARTKEVNAENEDIIIIEA